MDDNWRSIGQLAGDVMRAVKFEPTSGAPRRDALNADRPGPGAAGVDRAIGLGIGKSARAETLASGDGEVVMHVRGRESESTFHAYRPRLRTALRLIKGGRCLDRASPTRAVPRAARSKHLALVKGGGH